MDVVRILAEVRRLIAAMPYRSQFGQGYPDVAAWAGEAQALVQAWDRTRGFEFRAALGNIGTVLDVTGVGYDEALATLHEIRRGIELRAEVPTAVFVDKDRYHDFYEGLRNITAQAKHDLLFVDRYLDADFVGLYVPSVTAGTTLRLLVRKPDKTLLPAATTAAKQYGVDIQVRAHGEVHDRFVFVDKAACYHCGASFADAGKTGPTMLAPLNDYADMLAKHEQMWGAGGVLR